MPTCVRTDVRKAEDRARVAAYRVSMNAVVLPTGVCQGEFKLANCHPLAIQ